MCEKFLTIDLQLGKKWKDWGIRQVARKGNGPDEFCDIVIATTKKKDTFIKKLIKQYGLSFDFYDSMPRSKPELRKKMFTILNEKPKE